MYICQRHPTGHPTGCSRKGGLGGEAGGCGRAPQSWQSVPREHHANSAPNPPSSQSPSEENWHLSTHEAPELVVGPKLCPKGRSFGRNVTAEMTKNMAMNRTKDSRPRSLQVMRSSASRAPIEAERALVKRTKDGLAGRDFTCYRRPTTLAVWRLVASWLPSVTAVGARLEGTSRRRRQPPHPP